MMRTNYLRAAFKTALFAVAIFLLGAAGAFAQDVYLTAAPTTTTLPDGSVVPMWGYNCGSGATAATGGASCAKLNPNAPLATTLSPAGWSPVVITVPYAGAATSLTIHLANNLSFTPVGSTTANNIPTSLVIVGQVGGGLGNVGQRTTTTSPDHSAAQANVTWPIAGAGSGLPPVQGPRVQSFATEVAASPVATAVAPTALTWSNLRPGTYLIESGTHPSIQVPMGLYGILVVTASPAGATPGTAYGSGATAVSYNAEVPLAFSEIDPVQNNAVNVAVNTAGFNETTVWSGQPGKCGNPNSAVGIVNTCYPPAVNYTPLYYLINGVAFDKTHAASSLFAATAGTSTTAGGAVVPVTTGISGNVLLRMVNAGLRMHVPTVVGAQTGTAVAPALPPSGFSLIAEDGNPLPGAHRVQSEVFMAAGKTYDVMINAPTTAGTALPVYDRELSLSGNAINRDAGMLAYIGINGSALPAAGSLVAATANPDTYKSLVAGLTLSVSDPSKGVIANDINVYGVQLLALPANGTVTLAANGTFTYVPNAGSTATTDSFSYCANGTVTGTTCSSGLTATVNLGAATIEAASGIICSAQTYSANTATYLAIKTPGVLAGCTDKAGYPLKLATSSVAATGGMTIVADPNGGFTATAPAAGTYSFTFQAQNSQGTLGASQTATITFPQPSNLAVTVKDPGGNILTDYRWIIEEDRTFYVDPNNTTTTGSSATPVVPPTVGVNFHTSYMPVVATGCTGPQSCESGQTMIDPVSGLHVPAVCDQGNGACHPVAAGTGMTAVLPGQVKLDPSKRYYLSILPGDAANPFVGGYTGKPDCTAAGVAAGHCGHGMGGAPIASACTVVPPATTCTGVFSPITVMTQPSPYQPATLTVSVYQDDSPLNGEQDAGGGVDVVAPKEPGLGGFEITLFDDAGGTGDPTGQMTYDMFNQPLSNSLAGTIDPATGFDACPISAQATASTTAGNGAQKGIVGMIVTCPKYESDGKTLSALAGQAIVRNLMPGRYGVVATPDADRIARGEEWLQTNTLDGQKAHDSFLRIGEPAYFQEYGPAGFHVNIGFANPKIINSRLAEVCAGTSSVNLTNGGTVGPKPACNNSINGKITGLRMSRTPDERLYSSGSRDTFAFTQCYVSLGDPDGEDFAFAKCNADGTFSFAGIPSGSWRLSIFDQWNDQLMDGLSTPVAVGSGAAVCAGTGSTVSNCNMGDVPVQQWQADIYTQTFFDMNGNGVRDSNESGLAFVPTNVRFRDGSFSNFNNTDLNGSAGFNEVFPLFNWYVVETDSTRFKNTGTHVVYDAGGPADGTPCGGTTGAAPCGSSTIGNFMANTYEAYPLPANLSVPGAVYCTSADCSNFSIANGPTPSGANSTGRIDPPWVVAEAWQGFSGQNNFLEFGKKPYAVGETGGIQGHVVYASTRPFDDPALLLQTSWEPLVPNVTINLYEEGFAADGVTPVLNLVDSTKTSSWDDWAQGFRTDGIPNMNCPGQSTTDVFFYSLYNQPNHLNPATALPYNAQYKCYDGMHNWNQLQPAPYDGMYSFPSVTSLNPASGKPAGSNCHMRTALEPWGCVPNPTTATVAAGLTAATDPNYDPYRAGLPMLPAGKYVVEVVVPPGYELVKEEDKNILIGDNYIAPVTQQFGGLGNIFIVPDQAQVASAYNQYNAQNPTTNLGRTTLPSHEGDTGIKETFWPCVGEARIVPDYISLFPGSAEVAPFAGATRNLCDRKEVTLQDQSAALAKFYVFTSTHAAAHFTGVITDDYTSEFDPFSPSFGEKFAPPYLPVSLKDWAGNEVSRIYADQWGIFNGLNYSTWEVNPPNPTGYAPTMMVTCMNDPGPIMDTRTTVVNAAGQMVANPTLGQMITDPLFNSQYSNFCYELPFMPGQTQYMDTPVVPTSGFVGSGYNNPDCSYPDATPAIKEVDGDGIGPWVSRPGGTHKLTITALGDQTVNNYGYSGPQANASPFNQKTVTRHYGFGNAKGTVALIGKDGVAHNLANVSWSDTTITGTVPNGLPQCPIQQQAQYGGSVALCGELVITAANGKQSIDTVTVTIGGKAPTHVAATDSIQKAIDAAAPGDLIIVDPSCTTAAGAVSCATAGATHVSVAHNEMLLMWKPVRLQGVGAASSVVNANAHPAGKLMEPWRRSVDCLFGLALNGQPISGSNPFDSTGSFTCPTPTAGKGGAIGPNGNTWNYFNGGPNFPTMVVDRIPLEGILGWDTTVNGNLAEMLQEPSLMGAYEGAGITVLGKGVNIPAGSTDIYGSGAEAAFPDGSTSLTGTVTASPSSPAVTFRVGDQNPVCRTSSKNSTNPFPSNFMCNPSAIDGLTITNSSQGGGGIYVHGWGHNLQIANNRVQNNAGTLSGGMSIGQGESPEAFLNGTGAGSDPGTCFTYDPTNLTNPAFPLNTQLPYCLNLAVNVHHNSITSNMSTGDELFSATNGGAGGVSLCTGADYYKFNYNWVCGNLSTGDGGGVAHLGFSWNGDIEHNTIVFNQSTNPTIPTNGGGLIVQGTPPDITVNGLECGSVTDNDCVPGLSDGAGPGLVINANLFQGNAADSGSGGGIRFQAVNGTDVARFPAPGNCSTQFASGKNGCRWYMVNVTNNTIVDNVAGWDGAGVSLEDSLVVNLVNNTIAANDTTASSGVLFQTLGAPLASTQSQPTLGQQTNGTASLPQPSGLVTVTHSPQLTSSFTTGTITCPPGHYSGGSPNNGTCTRISYPVLQNDIFWQNRAFYIGVGGAGAGTLNQQNIVTLFPALTQAATGQCPSATNYWDLGVRGDSGVANHGSGFTLNPTHSILTSTTGYPGSGNTATNPNFTSQYCNGSRVPPEAKCYSATTGASIPCGYQVPPGIADATTPNPIFSMLPAATVDEGNNWINLSWGPLSESNPVTKAQLGNYSSPRQASNFGPQP